MDKDTKNSIIAIAVTTLIVILSVFILFALISTKSYNFESITRNSYKDVEKIIYTRFNGKTEREINTKEMTLKEFKDKFDSCEYVYKGNKTPTKIDDSEISEKDVYRYRAYDKDNNILWTYYDAPYYDGVFSEHTQSWFKCR